MSLGPAIAIATHLTGARHKGTIHLAGARHKGTIHLAGVSVGRC